MHHIRKKIIDLLTYSEVLRYAELKPPRIESNLFAYHLKALIGDGYIKKLKSGGYTLSAQGKAHVDRLSGETLKIRLQSKIITLLVLKNSKDQFLFAIRKHQPYIHKVALPSGKIHLQEKLESAARRELKEKTGLSDIDLRHAGVANIAITEGGEFISEVLAHVFTGTTDAEVSHRTGGGRVQPIWASFEDFEDSQLVPGTKEITKLVDSGEFFFKELDYDLPT